MVIMLSMINQLFYLISGLLITVGIVCGIMYTAIKLNEKLN
jgi:hypothetical protein